MNVAVTSYIEASDTSITTGQKQSSFSLKDSGGFKELLESTRGSLEESLLKEDKKGNILLMELLNLLNLYANAGNPGVSLSQNLGADSQFADRKDNISLNSLMPLLQDLVREFQSDGEIDAKQIQEIFIELKTKIPDIENLTLADFEEKMDILLQNNLNRTRTIELGTRSFAVSNNAHQQGDNSFVYTDNLDNKVDEKAISPTNVSSKEKTDNGLGQSPGKTEVFYDKDFFSSRKITDNAVLSSEYIQIDSTSYFKEEMALPPSEQIHAKVLQEERISSEDIFDQIAGKIHRVFKDNVHQVSIRLKPESLGNILIKVYAERDKLKAHLFVENPRVQDILRVQSQDFQDRIQQQGYSFSEMNIYYLSDGWETGTSNQHFNGHNNHTLTKKGRVSLNNREAEPQEQLAKSLYDYWGNESSVNYIA